MSRVHSTSLPASSRTPHGSMWLRPSAAIWPSRKIRPIRNTRTLSLRVARVAAINRRKQPDPLFVLAGGPGMAATTFYASASFALERIHRDRDIILIDQRGTGSSNALNCTLDDDALYRATDAQLKASAAACLQTLQKHADVRFYTTSLAVQDIDRVRKALGYRQINLYAVSYGTRVAQHYMRRFPAQTRYVILDGVVPPQNALGPATALNAEQALRRILARCAADSECRRHFGEPQAAYTAVRAALATRPVAVSLPDPTNGRLDKIRLHGLSPGHGTAPGELYGRAGGAVAADVA